MKIATPYNEAREDVFATKTSLNITTRFSLFSPFYNIDMRVCHMIADDAI